MPKMYPIQTSFAAGEISPKLYGRVETPGYQQGLYTCQNAFTDSRGPVRRRPGAEHNYRTAGGDARLFTFDYSREEAYVILFTHELLTISAPNNGGLGDTLLTNGSFSSGALAPWQDLSAGNGSVYVQGTECVLEPGPGDPGLDTAVISQSIFVQNIGQTYRIQVSGQFNNAQGGAYQLWVGSTPGSLDIYQGGMPLNGTYFTADVVLSTANVYVGVYAPGWSALGQPDTAGIIDAVAVQQVLPVQSLTQIATNYTEDELPALRAEMAPPGDAMVITHPNHLPRQITYADGPVWNIVDIPFTAVPAEWVGVNCPVTMAFFEGRSWWGGCASHPETLWASMSYTDAIGYYNMTIGVNPADALKFIVAEHGQIMWLIASKNLLMGTALREFIITSVDGVITPSDIQVEQQSAYGSAPIQPLLMGNEALFVSSVSTKVRSMWYQWTESGYLARELTYTNDHITLAGIQQMKYQRDPTQFLWFIRRDGVLVGCTYHKDGNDKPVYGWHSHNYYGAIKDATLVYRGDSVQLVLAMNVTVGGVEEIHIMEMSTESAEAAEPLVSGTGVGSVFLDNYTNFSLDGVETSVTGLEHFEGEEVTPMVDGAVQTNKVVTGGGITLDYSGFQGSVGKSYKTTLRTLPQAPAAPGGNAMSWEKSYESVFLRVLASALPEINGKRPAERHPSTMMNRGEPVLSQDIEVANLGWDTLSTILIEQELPYAFNLVAISGGLVVETL